MDQLFYLLEGKAEFAGAPHKTDGRRRVGSIKTIFTGRALRRPEDALSFINNGCMPTQRASLPIVIKAIGPGWVASGLAKRSKLAALDQVDELVPFGMAQPNQIVGLTYLDGVSLDGHFRALIAVGA